MAGHSRDDSMAGLHQIEADIQLCERFLSMDTRDSQDQAAGRHGAEVRSDQRGEGEREQSGAKGTAGGGSSSNMSQQRRKEILDRLLSERHASKNPSASIGYAQIPSIPLSEGGWGGTYGKQQTAPTTKPDAGSAGGGSSDSGGETREKLIQRLIAEKRARESRSRPDGPETQGNREQETNSASLTMLASRDRAVRQAWSSKPLSQGCSSPDTDSLDSEALKSGNAVGGAQQHYNDEHADKAAQRRPRPASAPRQRMTANGRLVGGQDSIDSEGSTSYRERATGNTGARPHTGSRQARSDKEARSDSVPKDRPSSKDWAAYAQGGSKVTRPRSPNLSRMPNMHSREQIELEHQEEMRQRLTFKPNIASAKYDDGQRKFSGERVHYLAQSKKAVWEARERAKLQRQEDEHRLSCSFKPKMMTGRNERSGASPSKVPVEVRLLNTASNKQALRQRAKRHLEEQELIKTCNGNSFRPMINQASRLLDKSTRPLHERVGQVQRERQQKLHEAKRKLEAENKDLTFRPAINDKSLRLAQRVASEMRLSGDLSDRLLAQHHLSVHKRLSKVAAMEHERAAQEPFHPHMNRNSEKILEHSDKFAGKDFYDRQASLVQRKLDAANAHQLRFLSPAPPRGRLVAPSVPNSWLQLVCALDMQHERARVK